jgi:hypothetical protein
MFNSGNPKKEMITLSYQLCGHLLAVGIDSDSENTEEIEQTFWSFWNHQATDGEFKWLSERFGYFWTDEDKLLKAMESAALFSLFPDINQFKGQKQGALPLAKKLARQRFDAMRQDFFVRPTKQDFHLFKINEQETEMEEQMVVRD